MLTDTERERIMKEHDHVAYLKHPELWPHWPLACVKKRNPSGLVSCGVIMDDTVDTNAQYPTPTVIEMEVFTASPEAMDTASRHKFKRIEGLVAAGWEVD